MRFSAYVRDADATNLAKARRFDSQGNLANVYVQVHGNEPDLIARNIAAFPEWVRTFGDARVAAWFIGGASSAVDAELVQELRAKLGPRFWVPNDEKPSEGIDRTAMLVACNDNPGHAPQSVIVSTTGTPSKTAMAYRDYSTHGASIELQGYGGEGDNFPPASITALVEDAFRLRSLVITAKDSPAWWVRVYLDNLLGAGGKIIKRWTWAQALAFDPHTFADGAGTLRLAEKGNTWGAAARETGFGYELVEGRTDEEVFETRRVFNRKTGRPVGYVFGVALYSQIRIALSVERPVSPAELAELAGAARVPGASIRGIGIYTLDNLTDEQAAALGAL